MQVLLQALAPQYGYDPTKTSAYNNQYRNPVFSYLTAERLMIIYVVSRVWMALPVK